MIRSTTLKERFLMRFKQLLVASLCAVTINTVAFADAPYVFAVDIDGTYSSYRPPNILATEDSPTPLTDPNPNPKTWTGTTFLDIRVEYYDTVTAVYWSAYEEWNYDSLPGYCVVKNDYYDIHGNHRLVPDHYAPITTRSIALNAPSYSNKYIGTEIIYDQYNNAVRRSIYVPGLDGFTNQYLIVNGSDYSAVDWYTDGTCYIYNP